jgi:hypothetical protein
LQPDKPSASHICLLHPQQMQSETPGSIGMALAKHALVLGLAFVLVCVEPTLRTLERVFG